MPDYLSPGVYIQELEGPAPITGVSTSIAAFVGMAERGPVNVPILCASPSDYTRWFGGLMTRADFADTTDPDRAHCYLPYAVAGFFNNSGQIAYVTRVLPEEATYAQETLFDRGSAASAASILMRAAAVGDGLGTTAATGALIVLDPAPAAGDFIRLDDGSVSEYLQVAANPAAVTDAAPLDCPLQASHAAATATALVYARNPIAPNGEALIADASTGDFSITVQSLDPLDTLADWLIELAAGGVSNIRVPTSVTKTGTLPNPAAPPATITVFTVSFAQPLTATFSSAAGAAAVNKLHTATPTADPLDVDANGGDLIVYATPSTALTLGDLIDIDTGPAREVRTITALVELALDAPTSIDWPAGTSLAAFSTGAFANTLTAAPSAGDQTLALASRNAVFAGSVLLVGVVPNQESVTVQSLAPPAGTGLDPGVVALAAPLADSHGNGDPVVLISSTNITAAAAAGAQALSLASRAGVVPGSILQIGTAPTQEYAVVLNALGARAVSGPDPGSVVLDTPLINAYANKAAVILSGLAAVAAGPACLTVTGTPAGSASVLVSAAGTWAAGDVLRASPPDGLVAFNTVNAVTAATLSAVTVAAPVQNTHPAGSVVVGRDPLIVVQALDQGGWGQRLGVAIQDEGSGLVSRAPVASIVGPTQLKLSTLTGIQPGSYLELLSSAGVVVDPATPLKVSSVNVANATIALDQPISPLQTTAVGLATPTSPTYLRSREFSLTVSLYRRPDPAVPSRNSQVIQSEVFHNLSMDPRHSQYFQTVIGAIDGPLRLSDGRPEGASWLIRTQDTATTMAAEQAPRLGPEALIDTLPNGLVRPAQHKLQGGDDSMITVDDDIYVGADDPDPRLRSGIFSLLNVPQISIVAVPGQGTPAIQAALIDHCENALYRFAVLDPQYPNAAIADIQAQRQSFDSKFAAIYYPWLTIPDPLPTNLASVSDFPLPPSGHVVGIYARVDDSRGVFKAPANEVVQGITGLTRTLVKGDQDVLNPSPTNINVIRDFRQDGRGIRIWGARVITSDDNYKYVPVKRLMMFIEQSLDVGLQDIVFEPNDSKLWASVERLIGNFLTTVWNSGGLQGDTPDQSFFVRCDLTTMTQDDIDNGRLIALVGVAPVKPAEFVIVQITLNMTSNAS